MTRDDAQALVARNTHEAHGLDDLPLAAIERSLATDRFSLVRGVVRPADAERAVARLRSAFRPEDDHATVGESPEDVRRNFQKLAIGTVTKTQPPQTYARLLRVIFSPFFAEDRYGVHGVLRRVATVRNRLLGLDDTFALDGIERGVWTAARIQQYPRGGGFLQSHVDASSVAVSRTIAGRYLQVLLAMTRRGADFERGGAFVEHACGRLDVEDGLEAGDLLVYDGRTTHGVADIDPHRVLDLRRLDGRLVGLVNLYEVQ